MIMFAIVEGDDDVEVTDHVQQRQKVPVNVSLSPHSIACFSPG